MIGTEDTYDRARRRPRSSFMVSVAGGRDAPGTARRRVLDRLDGNVDGQAREILMLLISELVTNSVLHAHADAASQIDLDVSFPPDAVRVEVSTPGVPFVRRSVAQDVGAKRLGGRGLFMVDRLSREWGGGPGEVNMVWFELDTARELPELRAR